MRLTASGLSRAEACIGSAVLPGYDEGGQWAATGNAVDHYVQTAKTKSRELASREAPEALRTYLDALTIERIPDGAEYQVAFALNVRTGEVRRIASRATGYPDGFSDEWIFGTSDIVGFRPGRALVWDLKWGLETIGRDPATDPQLGFYAICASSVAKVDECEVAFARAGWDAKLRPEVAILDDMAMDVMKGRILRIWQRAKATGAPRLQPGEHCGYCRVRRNCDAMVQPTALMLRGDLQEMARTEPIDLDTLRARVTALTPVERGRAWEVVGEILDRAGMVKDILKADAKQTPIPLSHGKELRDQRWGTREAPSPVAVAELAVIDALREKKREELRARGEITDVPAYQVRALKVKK